MSKRILSAFHTGKEVIELKRDEAYYWFIYVVDGTIQILQGQQAHCVSSGHVAVIKKINANMCLRTSENFAGYVIQIIDPALSEMACRYLLFMNADNETVSVIASGEQQHSILKAFQNITAEQNVETDGKPEILNLLLQELLVRMFYINPKTLTGKGSNRAKTVSKIQNWLNNEYYRPITLEDIATRYNMSASYLSHLFKDAVGVPIMQYLHTVRVAAARKYLEQTALSIKEIAEKCGFNDISNFGRTFKKESGCSPRQYRQHYHTIAQSRQTDTDDE